MQHEFELRLQAQGNDKGRKKRLNKAKFSKGVENIKRHVSVITKKVILQNAILWNGYVN